MDFQLTDEQKLLRDSVRTFTKQRSPVTRFRKIRDDGGGWDPALWREMGELGWLSLPFPESVGGFGGSLVDVGLLLEAFGATLVPEPYLASVVLAGTALLHAGNDAQHERWLAPLCDGRSSLALAHFDRGHRFAMTPATTATRDGDAWRVRGHKSFVAHGHRADTILVSATGPEGTVLFALPRDHAALRIAAVRTIDGLGAGAIEIDGSIADEHRLAGGSADRALELACDAAAAMAVSEGLGVCQATLELTVSHLRTREQFGTPIGAFQALQHRAVEMFVEVELVRSVAALAAIRGASADDDERRRAVSAAKVQLATSGRFVTQHAIQLHGGIGITDEHDVGLYFKRMHALGVMFGDEEHHLRRFAAQPSFVPA
jgi:alkylation response protein AidB-like acyl-CoA dehydrogenase